MVLRKLRQETFEFEAGLDYVLRKSQNQTRMLILIQARISVGLLCVIYVGGHWDIKQLVQFHSGFARIGEKDRLKKTLGSKYSQICI